MERHQRVHGIIGRLVMTTSRIYSTTCSTQPTPTAMESTQQEMAVELLRHVSGRSDQDNHAWKWKGICLCSLECYQQG
eukprot:6289391-Prorocentrum_lima.AAC.1